MNKLTIVTTTYNQEKYIEKAIKSFLMQKTNFDFKILISDDCSTDNTKKILTRYEKKYPKLIEVIYNKKNLGAMDNFIETLNRVHTEYVALCDGDDYWTDPLKLQKQVDILDSNKDFSLCFHKVNIVFEDNSVKPSYYPININDTTTFEDLIKDSYIPANSVVYRWKFIKENSFKKEFPQNIVPGDYYVNLYHAFFGKIKYINEVMSVYVRNAGGMWWLTSQSGKENEFYLKYGEKYLNFYKSVEKNFNVPEKTLLNHKNYICEKTAKIYLKNNQIDDFFRIYKDNAFLLKDKFNILSFEDLYNSYGTIKKLILLLFVDRHLFVSKTKAKIYNFVKQGFFKKNDHNKRKRNIENKLKEYLWKRKGWRRFISLCKKTGIIKLKKIFNRTNKE